MKLYKNQLNELFQLISNKEIKALLLYGPDKGEISDIISSISDKLKLPINNFKYSDINSDSLHSIANNRSLFSTREAIKINNVTPSISEEILKILELDLQNFLIFVSDELAPTSSIRKAFESKTFLVSLPCYMNDLKESMIIAKNEFAKEGRQVNFDDLKVFCQMVGGAKNSIKNEVKKLCNYSNSKIITEQDIIDLSSPDGEVDVDLLCFSFATGDKKLYFQELNKILNNFIEPIWVIRALGRYLLNILKVKRSDLAIDLSIKTLNPPIFFKHIPNFKKATQALDILNIVSILERLVKAEIEIKSGLNPLISLERLLISSFNKEVE
jgi:DNA polymerase-3 subunit delta